MIIENTYLLQALRSADGIIALSSARAKQKGSLERLPLIKLVTGHVFQELFVGLRRLKLVDQEFHRIDDVHRRKDFTQNPKAIEVDFVDQEIFFSRARLVDVHTRENTFLHELTIKVNFRVTSTFEFFKDDFIHT